MSFVNSDGVRLYVEETGSGDAIVFVHELNSDYRGWEAQVRWFSRRTAVSRSMLAVIPLPMCRAIQPVWHAFRGPRHCGRAKSAGHLEGTRRGIEHGRLRRAAFWSDVSGSGEFAGSVGRRLRLGGLRSCGLGGGIGSQRSRVSGTRIARGGRNCGTRPHARATATQRSTWIPGISCPISANILRKAKRGR